MGAQPHRGSQDSQPPPAVQQRAGHSSARQWDSVTCSQAEQFAESSQDFAVAEACLGGEGGPGMQESLPSAQRGAEPILTPPVGMTGGSGRGWHVRRVLSHLHF